MLPCVLIDNLLFFFGRPRPLSPKAQLEQEKKIRREIANSNERRRMQSINAGFQSLKTLLPHHAGEKLSKVSWSHAFGFFLTENIFWSKALRGLISVLSDKKERWLFNDFDICSF